MVWRIKPAMGRPSFVMLFARDFDEASFPGVPVDRERFVIEARNQHDVGIAIAVEVAEVNAHVPENERSVLAATFTSKPYLVELPVALVAEEPAFMSLSLGTIRSILPERSKSAAATPSLPDAWNPASTDALRGKCRLRY